MGFSLRPPHPLLLVYQNARPDADRTENNILVPTRNPSFVLCRVIIFIQPPGRFFFGFFFKWTASCCRYNCRVIIFNQPPGRSFFCFLFKFELLESVSWKSANVVLNRTNFSRKTIYWNQPELWLMRPIPRGNKQSGGFSNFGRAFFWKWPESNCPLDSSISHRLGSQNGLYRGCTEGFESERQLDSWSDRLQASLFVK